MTRKIFSIAVSLLISTTALAEVQKSDASGFIVHHNAIIPHPTAFVFAAMTVSVGEWWDPGHSFSTNAGNMLINSDCFCERWDNNLVRHLDTTIWLENSKVVMQGGLGPLKEVGLTGTMIWTVSGTEDGATNLTWKYYVNGYSDTDMVKLAPAVDDVLKQQIGRLVNYLN